VYRPETELQSHYFQAVLPVQFDEYVWFDETSAVTPLATAETAGVSGDVSLQRLRRARRLTLGFLFPRVPSHSNARDQ